MVKIGHLAVVPQVDSGDRRGNELVVLEVNRRTERTKHLFRLARSRSQDDVRCADVAAAGADRPGAVRPWAERFDARVLPDLDAEGTRKAE